MLITCLRHSIANKAFSDNHRLHPLSNEGVELAKKRREKLGNPIFDLVICSPLIRTRQTAQIVAGLKDDSQIVVVPDLFYEDDSEHGRKLNAMFERLGHATLKEYLVQPEADALYTLGHLGWKGVCREIAKCRHRPDPGAVLIVGHGIAINLLGIAAGHWNPKLQTRVLQETQGFRFVWHPTKLDLII